MDTSPNDESEQRSLDVLFKLLADEQRRQILSYLISNADQPVPLETIVEHLQTHTGTNRERLKIHLHHISFPKLADHGVIEYNPSLQLISYTERPRLEALLQQEQIPVDEEGESDID
ncbi:hypothetical protein NKF26_19195 [Haladaptatus sp. AB618]|uniref:DUF7344 domain-containing protein n=1 Tax=Haladaptatus sp. AB618 TaxID=2934173 RepID=UPI00209C00C5|nr:hypothetical protein [Haladaptatus sp. AB618]MCO8255938.1 hypothetical protein [Haladaptatus sp. AB618]